MTDIVERLREPANWLRQDKGADYKSGVNRYDRTPFEAVEVIVKLRARNATLEAVVRECDEHTKTPFLVLTTIRKEHGDVMHPNFAVLWRKRQIRRLKIQRQGQHISMRAARASLPAAHPERRRVNE